MDLKKVLFLKKNVTKNYSYMPNQQGGSSLNLPPRIRSSHGNYLKKQLTLAWEKAQIEKKAISIPTKDGMYLEFFSTPGYDLALKSLDITRSGIKLLHVQTESINGKDLTKSTVYIPKGKEHYFLDKINDYLTTESRFNKPKHQNLIDSINDINLAVIESFWNGKKEWIPSEIREWCEIWTTVTTKEELEAFLKSTKKLDIATKSETIEFPERTVLLCKVNKADLNNLIIASDNIAEFRRAAETKNFFIEMPNNQQTDWLKDAVSRIKKSPEVNDFSICILDTGVNNAHLLLSPILKDEDCDTYNPDWLTSDHDGHGTAMAGISAYDDLVKILETNYPVKITHILESAKILPPNGQNEPQLYGAITSQAISNRIIASPTRKRILCMAVTSDKYNSNNGHPTSWSASIDEVTSGQIDNKQKLMCISAGNIHDMNDFSNYFDSNSVSSIENPGQSWNAITVGAYTDLIPSDPTDNAIAPSGGLSPYSKTSFIWDKPWPIKPEILLEGGNRIKDNLISNTNYQSDELSLLTTNYKPQESLLTTIWATSSATAKASYLAAKIQAEYPDAWPETIRALMIHSAEWTKTMKNQFLHNTNKLSSYRKLLHTCGYGVPNLERAIHCAQNSVSLIVENELKPYKKENSKWKMNAMQLHEIPWPKTLLLEYGKTKFKLKITLSYFIEPCPGELGWKDKFRYASCGLRFKLNGSMSRNSFISSITAAMARDEELENEASSINWTLGEVNRNVGSIHSDVWETTAAQLATSNLIAVYPVVGWWRELRRQNCGDKTIRYSLIVSIETPEESIDIYTPILNMISTKVKTAISINTNNPKTKK